MPASRSGASSSAGRWRRAVAGHVLGINPFDQPNVQEAKDATKEILAAGKVEDPGFDELDPCSRRWARATTWRSSLDRTSETEDAIERARLAIRDRPSVATTTGFGPRFLHSTGQLHKGGRTAASSSRSWTGIGRPTCRSPASRTRSER